MLFAAAVLFLLPMLLMVPSNTAHATEDLVPLYRLYYRPTHEHLFTTDAYEKYVLTEQGAWVYEGIAWYAPSSGDPVYRLFSPATGDHLYTKDRNEYNVLAGQGWRQEGVAWYSVPVDASGAGANGSAALPVYRLFTPSLTIGSHFFTMDRYEQTTLLASGAWQDESVAWYAAARGEAAPAQPAAWVQTSDLNLENGTFTMTAGNVAAPGGARTVQFAVWSAANRSNLFTYAATQQADGTWTAQASYENHQALKETYTVLLRITGGDGVTEDAATTTIDNPFRDVVYIPKSNEVLKAEAYLQNYLTPEMTKEQKLRAAFDSFRNHKEGNPWIPHYTAPDWPIRYANSFFDTLSGNCMSYAAAFAYCARAIGYDNIYVCNSGGHGWCEIDGKVYDPEWAIHNTDCTYYAMEYWESKRVNYAGTIAAHPEIRIPLP